MEKARVNHMEYQPGMEALESDVLEKVLKRTAAYEYQNYTTTDVRRVLAKESISLEDYGVLLSPAAGDCLEEMAVRARWETRKHFGNSVQMFTPLYIANYCENHCVYCGFNCQNRIHRGKLTLEEIESELQTIAKTGLQ